MNNVQVKTWIQTQCNELRHLAGTLPLVLVLPVSALWIHQWSTLLPAAPFFIVGIITIVISGFRRLLLGVWIAVGCLSIAFVVATAQTALDRRVADAMHGVDYTVTGYVSGLVSQQEFNRRFRFRIEKCEITLGPCPIGRLVRLSWYGHTSAPVRPGQRWRLNLRIRPIHGHANPDGFDAQLHALQTGTDGAGYVRTKRKRDTPDTWREPALLGQHWSPMTAIAVLRDLTQQAMMKALTSFDAATRGTLIALVTGNQHAIPSQTWDVYNRTGTSHLMSISGLHVTMFAALAVAMVRRVLRQRVMPARWLLVVSAPTIAWSFGLLAALAYSAFSGWGVPAQRTCLMLAVAGIVLLSGRHCTMRVVLAWASAIVTLLDPWAVRSAGFWLSFAAVAAIVLSAQGQIRARDPAWRQGVRTQWAATVALIPLGAIWFGSVSIVSPVANAVAIPLVGALITPAALVGALLAVIWPAAGGLLLWLTAWITQGLLSSLEWIANWDQATWITGVPTTGALALATIGAFVLLHPITRIPRWTGLTLLTPLLFATTPSIENGNWSLLALDVGQGTSVLVQTARHTLLFDTGPSYGQNNGAGNRTVAPLMRARNIRHLDILVISHQDADHIGGAGTLLRRFGDPLLLSSIDPMHRLQSLARASKHCEQGQTWHWDGVRFDVIHPGPEEPLNAKSKTNARSCVIRIHSPAGSALLTGDIESGQEQQLLERYNASNLSVDVVLAPHHGSATSSSSAFLDAVNPRWGIFQVGFRNRFRHPAKRVLARYRDKNIEVLRTDTNGAIEFKFRMDREPNLIRYREQHRRYWH